MKCRVQNATEIILVVSQCVACRGMEEQGGMKRRRRWLLENTT
jgi:hypothetical protein